MDKSLPKIVNKQHGSNKSLPKTAKNTRVNTQTSSTYSGMDAAIRISDGVASPNFPGLGHTRGGPKQIMIQKKGNRNLNMAMNKAGLSVQRRHKTPLLNVPQPNQSSPSIRGGSSFNIRQNQDINVIKEILPKFTKQKI